MLLKLLAKEEQRIADGWLSALDLSGMRGAAPASDGITPSRAAAWSVVTRVHPESGRDHHQGVAMNAREITRRWFFEQCGVGLGAAALVH